MTRVAGLVAAVSAVALGLSVICLFAIPGDYRFEWYVGLPWAIGSTLMFGGGLFGLCAALGGAFEPESKDDK